MKISELPEPYKKLLYLRFNQQREFRWGFFKADTVHCLDWSETAEYKMHPLRLACNASSGGFISARFFWGYVERANSVEDLPEIPKESLDEIQYELNPNMKL